MDAVAAQRLVQRMKSDYRRVEGIDSSAGNGVWAKLAQKLLVTARIDGREDDAPVYAWGIWRAFVRDPDQFLVKHRHNPRMLFGRIDNYRQRGG